MTLDWRTAPLGQLCQIELGRTPARASRHLWDPDKRTQNVWLSIADLPQRRPPIVVDSEEYISDEGAAGGKLVREGTLLVSFKLTLGRLAFAGRDLYTNEAIAALTIRDDNVISNDYLYWYLTFFDWEAAAEGEDKVKGKTLNKAKLSVLNIVVPPRSEQNRIVAILEDAVGRIDAAAANAEKTLANVRELFKSQLYSTFSQRRSTWGTRLIEDHVRFIDYRGRTPTKTRSGLRLITAKNVKPGVLNPEPREFVDPAIYDRWMTRGIPRAGDVLFTTEAPLANVAQLNTDERVVFAQRVIIMQPQAEFLDATFLKFMLMSPGVQSRIHKQATGATAKGIKASRLKKIAISYPDLIEQRRIADTLTQLEAATQRFAEATHKKLVQFNQLRHSILHKAFSGALPANDAKDAAAA